MKEKQLTPKELEQLKLEKQKEDRTKKLFKRLKKNYEIYLFDKVQQLKQAIEQQQHQQLNPRVFETMLTTEQYQTMLIATIINELHEQYYSDNHYYCNNELFYNLKVFYHLRYKKILRQVINALF